MVRYRMGYFPRQLVQLLHQLLYCMAENVDLEYQLVADLLTTGLTRPHGKNRAQKRDKRVA
jgi:hypothetical protein